MLLFANSAVDVVTLLDDVGTSVQRMGLQLNDAKLAILF